jgi:hypothetical protein
MKSKQQISQILETRQTGNHHAHCEKQKKKERVRSDRMNEKEYFFVGCYPLQNLKYLCLAKKLEAS